MPTPNDFGPAVDARDPVLLRNALVRRVIYAIADTEDPTDFVANTSGQVPLGLAYGGAVFWLDPDDTTSSHDGVVVIVTSDGYRYHVSDFRMPWSVLGADVDEPPTGSSIGDAYLTSAAPSGDWAGSPEQVAVWTTRGWVFVEPQVGQLIYVADGTSRWVYLDENGDIVERFGAQPGSIPDLALIGGQRRYIVENQTTNDPPGSPGIGVYWIVGPMPTGAWVGETANIATSYDGTNWTFIAPPDGVEAFDRSEAANYIYRTGTGWVSAAGAWTRLAWVRTEGTGTTSADTSNTIWNGTATRTTSMNRCIDDATIAFQASRSGATLKIRYHANLTQATPGAAIGALEQGIALFRDSEANAIDWVFANPPVSQDIGTGILVAPSRAQAEFFISAVDAASHTYRVAVISRGGINNAQTAKVTAFSRRVFSIEEAF